MKWWEQSCLHWIQRWFLSCTIYPPHTALKHDKTLGNAEPWACWRKRPLSCGAKTTFGPHLKCVSTRQNCSSWANFFPFCASTSTFARRSAFWQLSDANASAFSSLIEQWWHNGFHLGSCRGQHTHGTWMLCPSFSGVGLACLILFVQCLYIFCNIKALVRYHETVGNKLLLMLLWTSI